MAVIAHPARHRFTPHEEYALLIEFKMHGGRVEDLGSLPYRPGQPTPKWEVLGERIQ